mmetsp:Transcript_16118/g.47883  ORF Transcript_16118/g.47883 Transcript_16118/m.47883 type:complete len:257 (-) Transcript_16118:410-1180(-)
MLPRAATAAAALTLRRTPAVLAATAPAADVAGTAHARVVALLPKFRQLSCVGAGAAATVPSSGDLHQLAPPDVSVARALGKVGFIGLGAMGRPMALNLSRAGFDVLVHDQSAAAVGTVVRSAREAGLPGGVEVAGSPRDVAEATGVTAVVTMLPDTEHVRSVYEGSKGLLSARGGLSPSLLIDSSTISPTYTRGLAEAVQHAQLGVNAYGRGSGGGGRSRGASEQLLFMDAPVSGGVPGATAASLTFMVTPGAAGC